MTNDEARSEFAALWPGGQSGVEPIDPVSRPKTLDGKTIAFIWDYAFRGEEIFPVVQDAIASKFDGVNFVGHDVFGSTFGGDEHEVLRRLPERLREHSVDAVVSGIGC